MKDNWNVLVINGDDEFVVSPEPMTLSAAADIIQQIGERCEFVIFPVADDGSHDYQAADVLTSDALAASISKGRRESTSLAARMASLLRKLAAVVKSHPREINIPACGMLARAIELEAWHAFYDFTDWDQSLDEWDPMFSCVELDADGPPIEQAILNCVNRPKEPV